MVTVTASALQVHLGTNVLTGDQSWCSISSNSSSTSLPAGSFYWRPSSTYWAGWVSQIGLYRKGLLSLALRKSREKGRMSTEQHFEFSGLQADSRKAGCWGSLFCPAGCLKCIFEMGLYNLFAWNGYGAFWHWLYDMCHVGIQGQLCKDWPELKPKTEPSQSRGFLLLTQFWISV